MSPLSANTKLCRLLIRPSGECFKADRMYHSLVARRTESRIVKFRFDLFSEGVTENA